MVTQIKFMKEFLKHPIKTGSIAPSSNSLAIKIAENINPDQDPFVIELGPGTGALSKTILKRVNQKNKLIAFEINQDMVSYLQKKLPQLQVISESAENIHLYLEKKQLPLAQNIISGLPWAIFNEKLQDNILNSISKSLDDKGCFSTFAYLHALKLKSAKKFRKKLEKNFQHVTTTSPVWKNIPPAIVYHCFPQ